MERMPVCVTVRKDLKEKADKAVETGKYAGVTSFSSFLDLAIDNLLNPKVA